MSLVAVARQMVPACLALLHCALCAAQLLDAQIAADLESVKEILSCELSPHEAAGSTSCTDIKQTCHDKIT